MAIEIEDIADGVLQGYSAALGLYLRCERGELLFFDPETGRSLPTLADERECAEEKPKRVSANSELQEPPEPNERKPEPPPGELPDSSASSGRMPQVRR